MIYHFVVGDMAAAQLTEALAQENALGDHEVVVLKDILNVGPLKKEEGQSFSEMRAAFWQDVLVHEKMPVALDDMERMLEVSKKMYDDTEAIAWCWMAPLPADVCAYHWLLPYLSKHAGRFFLVNIAGLPFLNDAGKLFFPQSISQLSPREIIKAKKLARPVTASEIEVDSYEWKKLQQENEGIRVHEGGKKLVSKPAGFYDPQLLQYVTAGFQKAGKVVTQAMNKQHIPTGDLYLSWRLRQLAAEGKLLIQGDPARSPKDFEVKLPEPVTAAS